MTRIGGKFAAVVIVIVGSLALVGAQGKSKPDPNLMTIGKTGLVLRTTTTKAIFWGSGWNDPAVAKDIITGMDTFFQGFGGSHFAGLATEYFDKNGQITSTSTYAGHVVDLSDPPAGIVPNSAIIAEACTAAGNNPDPNGVYFVYTSLPAPVQCAIRIIGSCGRRAPIHAVYIPYMTGEDPTCRGVLDHGDDGSVTGHSHALGMYGNVSANQLMNTITDPNGDGWKDAFGDGFSFKCDGVFIPAGTYETFTNGSQWTVRMKWSNAAYLAGTGTANGKGLRGCVY